MVDAVELKRHGVLKAITALLLIVAVVITLVFAGRMFHTSLALPAKKPPALPGTTVLQVLYESFYSADDAAVQVLRQAADGQSLSIELEVTHDGGETWTRTGITQLVIKVIWLDSNHFIVARDDASNPGGWQITTDGGQTWHAVGTTGTQTNDMYFINRGVGWASSCPDCGQSVTSPQTTISHTTDSGAHWQVLGSPVSWPGVEPIGLYFTDSSHGFMATNSSNGRGQLVETQDGGRTWHLIDLPNPPDGWSPGSGGAPPAGCTVGTCTLLPKMCGAAGVVLVQQQSPAPWFTYTTSDGGRTWGNPHEFPVHVWQNLALPWQAPLDLKDWWIADQQGILHQTSDGGRTWNQTRLSTLGPYTLTDVKPVGEHVVWGTVLRGQGPDHFLMRSSDDGATWSLIELA